MLSDAHFVESIESDESLEHQLKRQDRVNFSTSVLLCALSPFKSFETMNMNFFNCYRLNNIYKIL